MTLFFWIGFLCFITSLGIALVVAVGMRRMTQVKDIPVPTGNRHPRVSIIIPARNEARAIEPALKSLLSQDYKNLEVIAVNDRSTDFTGRVLTRVCKDYPALQVHNISELPEGWLGKNYALQFGAEWATGEYLLFTDADVIMKKSTLSRAMHHVHANCLDHLSIFFENHGGGGLLNALFLDIGGGLLLLFKPWKAKNPKSRRFMGVGAFNLIKTAAYKSIGKHEKIAMHPIDDIMLGKLVKRHGLRQDCLLGSGFVSVPWYGTIKEFIDGLMKNTFAVYQYKISNVAVGVFLIFMLGVFPLWAFFLTHGATKLFFLAVIIIRILSFVYGFRQSRINSWYAFWSLITPYINIYITFKAAILTIRNNGISWRGTHYPLEKLKQYVL